MSVRREHSSQPYAPTWFSASVRRSHKSASLDQMVDAEASMDMLSQRVEGSHSLPP